MARIKILKHAFFLNFDSDGFHILLEMCVEIYTQKLYISSTLRNLNKKSQSIILNKKLFLNFNFPYFSSNYILIDLFPIIEFQKKSSNILSEMIWQVVCARWQQLKRRFGDRISFSKQAKISSFFNFDLDGSFTYR